MGCPVSIGPEIILRYFSQKSTATHSPVVIGDIGVLERLRRQLNISLRIIAWKPDHPVTAGTVPVLELSSLPSEELRWGQPDKMTGQAMARYIETAVEMSLSGELSGIVTCPISKASLNLAGYCFPGHTEMLAHLTGSPEYTMMMGGNKLKVVLATIHCSLASVKSHLKSDSLVQLIKLTDKALREDFGIAQPRIGLAGLNPHCGENGLFGTEETTILAPAATQCRAIHITVSDPQPPDTVFYQAVQGKYDVVICMYHDQGLIPFKLLHFKDGVNVTLGLPIVRTSVDHGTAYDIAGKGLANWKSLAEAINWARQIVALRQTHLLSKRVSS